MTISPYFSRRRLAAIGVSAVALCALAACGSGSDASAPQVAALPSSAGSAPSASAPTTTAGRPQERLDDTPAEHEALIDAWDKCLLANGAPHDTGAGVRSAQGGGDPDAVGDPVPKKAYDACLSKEPLGPPELDPSKNPNYRNDMLAEISCLNAHGVKVHLTTDTSVYPDGLSWTFDSDATPVPADEGQLEDSCEQSAFADKH